MLNNVIFVKIFIKKGTKDLNAINVWIVIHDLKKTISSVVFVKSVILEKKRIIFFVMNAKDVFNPNLSIITTYTIFNVNITKIKLLLGTKYLMINALFAKNSILRIKIDLDVKTV